MCSSLYVISGNCVKHETLISIESCNQIHLVCMIYCISVLSQEEIKGCSARALDDDNGTMLASKEVVCWNSYHIYSFNISVISTRSSSIIR